MTTATLEIQRERAAYTLTRQQFIDLIERVLEIMGAHFRDYEEERLREFARNVQVVTFGSWNDKPGCPLQQTGMCTTIDRMDSVFELFIDHYDGLMRQQWGLRWPKSGSVKIIP